MYIANHHMRIYGVLCQVNKAFYYSAMRLIFQSFVVRLDLEVQEAHSPFIKFEELCRNANARYVERLVIRCCERNPAGYNPRDFAGSCKSFALLLEQFPSLRSVVLVFFRYPYGSEDMFAGDPIEQIINALRLAQLPKLERLRTFYEALGEPMCVDGFLKVHRPTIPLSRGL
jgi:hypothetical protein